MSIAKEIYKQIGHKAFVLIGAYNFIDTDDGLRFRIRGSRKVNMIQIKLNEMDLYDIKFYRVEKLKYKIVKEYNDVYFDMLKGIIEEETGLYLTL